MACRWLSLPGFRLLYDNLPRDDETGTSAFWQTLLQNEFPTTGAEYTVTAESPPDVAQSTTGGRTRRKSDVVVRVLDAGYGYYTTLLLVELKGPSGPISNAEDHAFEKGKIVLKNEKRDHIYLLTAKLGEFRTWKMTPAHVNTRRAQALMDSYVSIAGQDGHLFDEFAALIKGSVPLKVPTIVPSQRDVPMPDINYQAEAGPSQQYTSQYGEAGPSQSYTTQYGPAATYPSFGTAAYAEPSGPYERQTEAEDDLGSIEGASIGDDGSEAEGAQATEPGKSIATEHPAASEGRPAKKIVWAKQLHLIKHRIHSDEITFVANGKKRVTLAKEWKEARQGEQKIYLYSKRNTQYIVLRSEWPGN